MVSTPLIFAKDPIIRLKRKKLGPTIHLKDGRREWAEAWAMESEEGDEEDTPRPTARRKGKKTSAPLKKKQFAKAPRLL